MGKYGLTATEIGYEIGASPQVVNHLLFERGLTSGPTSEYGPSEAGLAFGVQRSETKNNSWDTFEWNNWDESVIAELDATPDRIAEAYETLRIARAERRAEKEARSAEHWAAWREEQDRKNEPDAPGNPWAALGALLIVGGTIVGGVYAVKGVRWVHGKWSEKRAVRRSEAAADGEE